MQIEPRISMKQTSVTRRNFLRGTGVALALPILDANATHAADAKVKGKTEGNTGAGNKHRMIMICTSLGMHPAYFFPEGTGDAFKASPYLKPLNDARGRYTVFSGMQHPRVDGGHSAENSFLTAAPHPGRSSFKNTISLDQYAAERMGHLTRFGYLALSTSYSRSLSWTRGGVEIPAEGKPSEVFARLFLDGSEKEIKQQVARLQDGQSIMDIVSKQAKDMQRKLGKTDQQTLDQYFNSVRELENRLIKAEQWTVKPKPQVKVGPPKDIDDKADFIGRTNLMYDLAHLAIQTDSTRLITLFVGATNSPPPIKGVDQGWHNLSHHGKDPLKIEQLKLIEVAQMEALGGLLKRLKDNKEGDSNLLDKTMVFFGSNLGDASSHHNRNLPVLLAGGGFKHAGHIAFEADKAPPLANVFVSMLQRMGVETDQFASATGRLSELKPA